MRLLPEMAQGDLHAALKHCSALVNSSVSEGMSAAVLEVSAGAWLAAGTGPCVLVAGQGGAGGDTPAGLVSQLQLRSSQRAEAFAPGRARRHVLSASG